MTQQDDITQRVLTAEHHLNELMRLTQPWPNATIPCATVRSHVEQALSKLRAPVSSIREGFELTYAADADDPACAADLSHFTNGWRACLMSQVRAPVADERALDLLDTLFTAYENGTPCYEEPDSQGGYLGMAFRIDDDTFRACADLLNKERPRTAGALASAPVAGADRDADERAVMTPAKAAYVEHFGHAAGWLSYKGSWFIEGFKAGQKSAPVAGEAVAWEAVRQELAIFLMSATGRSPKEWHRPLDNASERGALAKMRACLAAPQASAEPRQYTHAEVFGPMESAWNSALDQAAAICDSVDNHANPMTARDCADAIRALKTQAGKDGGQQRAGDDLPAFMQSRMTPWGLLVRAGRIILGTTLMDMSKALGMRPSELSAYECDRQRLTDDVILAVMRFFDERGLCIPATAWRKAALSAPQAEQGERDA